MPDPIVLFFAVSLLTVFTATTTTQHQHFPQDRLEGHSVILNDTLKREGKRSEDEETFIGRLLVDGVIVSVVGQEKNRNFKPNPKTCLRRGSLCGPRERNCCAGSTCRCLVWIFCTCT
ncbi:hypothetical protein Ahia01_000508500 [Argonauta hians]